MAYSVAGSQAWGQTHNANSAALAAGAIPVASLGNKGVLALGFGDIADATDVEYTLLPFKIRVLDVWTVKTVGAGNAGNTVTLRTAAAGAGTAVTSAMVLNADASVTRTTVIDDAGTDFGATASLFLRFAKLGGVNNGIVYVEYFRVA